MWPFLNAADLLGAVHLPRDGQTNPIDTTQALAKGARSRGARIIEGAKVDEIVVENGRAVGVRGAFGDIQADVIVNCAGMWARELGAKAGVALPLHAAEHFYIVTEAIPELPRHLPVLRDADRCAYFKEDAGKLLVGWFEPVAKPWGMNGIPESFSFDQLPEDLEHIEPLLEAAIHRVPALGNAGIQLFFNGPESFTPDDRYLLGETPEIRNLFVAAGFNSIGIQSAGGAGKVLSDLDRRRTPAHGSVGCRRPPDDAVPTKPRLSARSHGGDPRPALRHALAISTAGIGARRAPLRAA